jgi:ATP-dependent DNA ligase
LLGVDGCTPAVRRTTGVQVVAATGAGRGVSPRPDATCAAGVDGTCAVGVDGTCAVVRRVRVIRPPYAGHGAPAPRKEASVDLPVMPPVAPMLAKAVKTVPEGEYLYEPKWDGFRAIIFRDGDDVEIGSRNERPFTRYFPEVVAAAKAQLPERCVVDGEIVIVTGDRLDFEALLNRIHPAASRVKLLAEQTPASFVAFDLLALADTDLRGVPMAQRRAALEEALAGARPPVHVTRATRSLDTAREWLDAFEGAGLDGVVSKPLDGTYRPDVRAMLKTKHERTADCVVAGFRWHKSGPVVGSLLLGIYDDGGRLQHVGVAASFPMKRRAELVEELAPLRMEDPAGHPWQEWAEAEAHEGARLPGAQSRWNAGKDLSWIPLRPERVVEVAYDHMEGTRFRHTAQFRRWRPDRDPASCTFDQIEVPVQYDLADVLD